MLQETFNCLYCDKSYTAAVSLGGHVSKAHPGHSSAYSQKLEVRKSREQERNFLKQAKEMLLKEGIDPKKYRIKATMLKKQLMA